MSAGQGAYFGRFGGCFMPEVFMPVLLELESAMQEILHRPQFQARLDELLQTFAGRPTPLTHCDRLSKELGFDLWLKREDLLHTGSHKISNALGQALLAREMGRKALVAESCSGRHGVATAAAAAHLGLECTIFMGREDMERQRAAVQQMRLLGASVKEVQSGEHGLKEGMNEALRFWLAHAESTHYCLGSAVGPHPYPTLVAGLQEVIGRECRAQLLEKSTRLPDAVVTSVGGGSSALGMFHAFLEDLSVRLIGIEGAGSGETGRFNAASLTLGSEGVLHGAFTMLLQNNDGQVEPSQSVASGLDYPGVGPELAYLRETGRVYFSLVRDSNVLNAAVRLCRSEGILPSLESAHALAWVLDHPKEFEQGCHVVVNLSDRGESDLDSIAAALAQREA